MEVLDILPLFFGEERRFKLRTFELGAFGLLTRGNLTFGPKGLTGTVEPEREELKEDWGSDEGWIVELASRERRAEGLGIRQQVHCCAGCQMAVTMD